MVIQTRSTQQSVEHSPVDLPGLLAEIVAADRPESLAQGFRDAVGAVTDSTRRGFITEQQADELITHLAALMIQAQFEETFKNWGLEAYRDSRANRSTRGFHFRRTFV